MLLQSLTILERNRIVAALSNLLRCLRVRLVLTVLDLDVLDHVCCQARSFTLVEDLHNLAEHTCIVSRQHALEFSLEQAAPWPRVDQSVSVLRA